MAEPERDEEREEHIINEIIVDAYGPEEQAMGWYYYLQEQLQFPFRTQCAVERATSPLGVGDKAEVVDMAPEEECEHEMFVLISWKRRKLAVPLAQLAAAEHLDEETSQAIEDWHYWIDMGYEFG